MILDAPAILAPSAAYSCKYAEQSDATPTNIRVEWQSDRKKKSTLTARPTAPRPKIATVEPFGGFATLIDAPRPSKRNLVSHPASSDIYPRTYIPKCTKSTYQ